MGRPLQRPAFSSLYVKLRVEEELAFNPKVLQPDPDPFWVRELRRLDPDLRLVWGYSRYLRNRWIVEKRIPIDRYFEIHRSLFESDEPRFVDQPIFDDDQAVYDEQGILMKEVQVGVRKFDLAPEYEYLMAAETPAGEYRPFAEEDMLILRRSYAWNVTHPISRKEWEEAERVKKDQEAASKQREDDLFMVEAFDQARREAGVKVQSGPGGGK